MTNDEAEFNRKTELLLQRKITELSSDLLGVVEINDRDQIIKYHANDLNSEISKISKRHTLPESHNEYISTIVTRLMVFGQV
ncbi:hypothetical protein R1T16_05590 [Flavobacterium sp. DG1-102-2]|uniref:hypothetical protein n=1 Tax=Flavobacterium sp. DG1-102-2 TaxID=3081663 RepID=UPI002949F3E7|nr:hypothetical protein [Flavobacterium sp. DG1-102-2]MDV6167888.1 hypothetical protein [Flavobacterium sp. DG1-102-2]